MPILTDDEITALLKACAVPRGRAAVFRRTVVLGRRSTPCRSSHSAARASRRSVRSRAETSDCEKTFQEQVLGLCSDAPAQGAAHVVVGVSPAVAADE